jgi:maltokinase
VSALAALATPSAERTLADALREWLPRQRWFAGKARTVAEVAVHDVALFIDAGAELLWVAVDVRYDDGGSERYQVPLVVGEEAAERDSVAAILPEGPLVDALTVPDACALFARLCLGTQPYTTVRGAAVVSTTERASKRQDIAVSSHSVRAMGAEQSNSSVVLGDLVLKLFRKLEPGENPDVELTRALTARGVDTVPVQYGALELDGREPTTLAVLTALVPGATEGWELATREVEGLADRGERGVPGLLDDAESLGEAVARTHAALADAFGRQPTDPALLRAWADGMRAQAQRVLATAGTRAPDETAVVAARADELDAVFADLPALTDAGPVVRVHGDLHLGQVLRAADGRWMLLDFEGEPARPLRERRLPHSPLKDVAGMLRSFDYAAAQVRGGSAVENWRATARRRFVAGYERVAKPANLLPPDAGQAQRLRDLLELDKAVYELGYELANRPDWVRVPVAGIVAALDRIARPAATGRTP